MFYRQKTMGEVIDMFYDGNQIDCTMYPEEEDIMVCLRAKLGLKDGEMDNKVNCDNLKVGLHIRERRNRRSHFIREALEFWQESMPEENLTASSNIILSLKLTPPLCYLEILYNSGCHSPLTFSP